MPRTYATTVELFQATATSGRDRPFLGVRRGEAWTWQTYGEIAAQVDRFRAGLALLGVGKGDRVAVIANNRVEWAIGLFAVQGLGAAYVPMYEQQLDRDWQFILADSGAKVALVANQGIAKRVEGFKKDLPALAHVVVFDAPPEDASSFAAVCAKGSGQPVPVAAVTPDDLASLVYTSGTTGNPKGVELTHGNVAHDVCSLTALVDIGPNDRSLAFLPWAHVYGGQSELLGVVYGGGSAAICEATDKIVPYLAEVKPTFLFAVPRIWNKIYDGVQKQMRAKPPIIQKLFAAAMAAKTKQKAGTQLGLMERLAVFLGEKLIFGKIREKFGGRLKYACSGAAALSPDVAEFVDNLGILVLEGYGMTETSSAATASLAGQRRVGSVGKAIPGVTIKLDKQAPGADEENGEIVVYGPVVMRGYHRLPEDTKAAMTADGGMRTGDLGRFDKDGFLYITGRVKELYKLENGKYVAPAPIEERLALSPYITQIMINGSGKPHNVAIIVPEMTNLREWCAEKGVTGDPLASPEVKQLIAGELEKYSDEIKGYEKIRDFLLVSEEFSTANDMLTPSLKIKRRVVMKKYGDALDALYKKSPVAKSA